MNRVQTKSRNCCDPVDTGVPSQMFPRQEHLPVTVEHLSRFCTIYAAKITHIQSVTVSLIKHKYLISNNDRQQTVQPHTEIPKIYIYKIQKYYKHA